ncbi:NAD(P)H-dependent flavin oxidoreductase [Alteraurantiacibacter aquimixticola]|uniref:Nitronate monooxygenase n=1 Tax=Alteraurantiacibacter aquimixticola TaxID=2489173 RepID=A0A4T3F594_9SPHN|nr:nitronate monooxygenase [Alteraurantiacibacter aquimixticola]TIX50678.1 nitronate monooxygenase [Alteraurantiacibacter aquimixticola]
MSKANALFEELAIPAIVAPMFLVSGTELVVACSSNGLLGTFPTLNARTTEDLDAWFGEMRERLDGKPFGANLIVHKSNPRLEEDLALVVKHKVPLVITSLGAVPDLIEAVHSYGGVVMHDVIGIRHAKKAIGAGADGLIAVAAGAGGHAGTLSPFALTSEIREFFDGPLALSGCITHGRQVLAAKAMGADFAYVGSHFIPTVESMASDPQKQMMIEAKATDIVYTDKVTGVGANFMRASLEAASLPDGGHGEMALSDEAKAWKNIWSAGHGVGATHAIRPAAEICSELIAQYNEALKELTA